MLSCPRSKLAIFDFNSCFVNRIAQFIVHCAENTVVYLSHVLQQGLNVVYKANVDKQPIEYTNVNNKTCLLSSHKGDSCVAAGYLQHDNSKVNSMHP